MNREKLTGVVHFRLQDWAVVGDDDPWIPPELRRIRVSGKVYDHDAFHAGEEITTSPVVHVEGRVIRTRGGVESDPPYCYVLDGPPSADYAAWCGANRIPIDEEHPIKVTFHTPKARA